MIRDLCDLVDTLTKERDAALRLVATQAAEMEGRVRGACKNTLEKSSFPEAGNAQEAAGDGVNPRIGTGIFAHDSAHAAAQPDPAEVETRLAEIEAREAKATGGPWTHRHDPQGCHPVPPQDQVQPPNDGYPVLYLYGRNRKANGEFSSHARTDIPWLAAQLRVALAGVELVKAELHAVGEDRDRWRAEAGRLSLVRDAMEQLQHDYAARKHGAVAMSECINRIAAALAAPAEPAASPRKADNPTTSAREILRRRIYEGREDRIAELEQTRKEMIRSALGRVHDGTLKLLRSLKEPASGAELSRMFGCSDETMRNRLRVIERNGLATSKRHGVARLWEAAPAEPAGTGEGKQPPESPAAPERASHAEGGTL
jgi:hypothetical protein